MIHEQIDSQARTARLTVDEGELSIIANALNEVCNGVDIEDFEFAARLGGDRAELRQLLREVGAILDELSQSD